MSDPIEIPLPHLPAGFILRPAENADAAAVTALVFSVRKSSLWRRHIAGRD
jgi:hypothetical protein